MKLHSFYSSNTQSLLNESLNDAEGAMNCPETRLGAIELKISLLILLQEFEAGYKFVFSLSEMDFELLYRKK